MSEASHTKYSCKQKRRVREQEEGRNAQISLNRREEWQINMIRLGKGILLEMCIKLVVMRGKSGSRIYQALRSQLGSTCRCQRILSRHIWLSQKQEHTLDKTSEHATSCLQQRMANDNLEEPLQTFPALLDDGVVELVEIDLSGQWGNGDASALALKNIAEVLKV